MSPAIRHRRSPVTCAPLMMRMIVRGMLAQQLVEFGLEATSESWAWCLRAERAARQGRPLPKLPAAAIRLAAARALR